MSKAVVRLGYHEYVLSLSDAGKIVELIATAERFERVYVPADKTKESYYTYHVYDQDAAGKFNSIEFMTEDMYRMAKLAGKPEKK